jgi:hypothetical protein
MECPSLTHKRHSRCQRVMTVPGVGPIRDADDGRPRRDRHQNPFGDRRSLEAGSYLTADNKMTRKPNFALNAEIESSGGAANSARCALAFLSLCPNRDRVGLRQAAMSAG